MILERVVRETDSHEHAIRVYQEWVQGLGYQIIGEVESWSQANLFTHKTDVIVLAKVRKMRCPK